MPIDNQSIIVIIKLIKKKKRWQQPPEKNMKKIKKIKLWHISHNEDAEPEVGGTMIPRMGFVTFDCFYLCVPEKGFYSRAANASRYGDFRREYFIDGDFVGTGRVDREEKGKQLYDAGYEYEAREYVLGHRLWRETKLGGEKINPYKEAARRSHDMCDLPGKAGHEERQLIRKQILGY